MVRSNLASGVGRSVTCETLETRSFFSVAAFDTTFKGGITETHFSGNYESATAATVLKSGKLLVGGTSEMGGRIVDVLAVYNKDGYLSNSFDGDGKAILSNAISDVIGQTKKIVALPDGGAIVAGDLGFVKILANGRVDTSYGHQAGIPGVVTYADSIDKYRIQDVGVTASGNATALVYSPANNSLLSFFYDSTGAVGPNTGGGSALSNANFIRYTTTGGVFTFGRSGGSPIVTKYSSSLKLDAAFGSMGSLSLAPAFNKFLTANGPFKVNEYDNGTPTVPTLTTLSQQTNADGSMLLKALIGGTTAKLPKATVNNYYTLVFINIDKAGKNVTFTAAPDTDSGVNFEGAFRPYDANVNGVFYTDSSTTTDVRLGDTSTLKGSVTDADGSVYVFGTDDAVQRNGFKIAKLKPITSPVTPPPVTTGVITGVLYNDDNGDQIKQANETINAGRVVYIDSNNNGYLSPGELSTTTDANGRYTFNLAPGSYRIRRTLPSGYRTTTDQASWYYNQTTTVTAGVTTTLDIGSTSRYVMYGHVTYGNTTSMPGTPLVGQRVFYDDNKNNQYDDGEYFADTDSTGFYTLAAPAGMHRLTSIPPAGYRLSTFFYPEPGYADLNLKAGDRGQLPLTFDVAT